MMFMIESQFPPHPPSQISTIYRFLRLDCTVHELN